MNAMPLLLLFLTTVVLMLPSSAAQAAVPVELKTDRFILRFAADGKPASLLLLPEQKELLNVRNPGSGFVIRAKGGGDVPLVDLRLVGDDQLAARSANGSQEVVFQVHRATTHLGFRIERLKGFPTTSDLSLNFEMNADPSVRVLEHDYMTFEENRTDGVRVRWPGLWQRAYGDPLGGFSLYCKPCYNE